MKKLSGILLIAISAAAFGTLAIFGRWAYTAGIDTLTLLFLRFTIAALLMSIVLMVRHENLPRGKVYRRNIVCAGPWIQNYVDTLAPDVLILCAK